MQIAYLILAHNEPLLLKRMVDRLNQPGVSFYIHFDKKIPVAQLEGLFAAYPNVRLISRYSIFWMGYRMVQATTDLLTLAHAGGYKYYVLMSGQDYPIKSNAFISRFFVTHNCDFIDYNRMADLGNNIRRKVWHYHFYDTALYNPRVPRPNKFLVRLYFGLHRHLRKLFPHRRFYKGMEPYFGSQWFGLTHDTVGYVLSFLKDNPGYQRFMKYTEGPDEVFFQTIILNSPRRENVAGYQEFTRWLQTRPRPGIYNHEPGSLRYMDWEVNPGPAVLDMSYFSILAADNKLFARKFGPVKSAELLDEIDKKLLTAG